MSAIGGNAKEGSADSAKKSEKVEKPIVKDNYDLKLSGFDAAKKIALIKEVRAILNLGLKEVNAYILNIG